MIVPPSPGVLCAFGDATTLLRHESGRAFTMVLGKTSVEEVVEGFAALLAEVKRVMRDDQGVAEGHQVLMSFPFIVRVIEIASAIPCAKSDLLT